MRDRLIELMKKANEYASGVCIDHDEAQEICAEYLLAEGVLAPPCKVGDIVYRVCGENTMNPYIWEWEILEIMVYQDKVVYRDDGDNIIENKDFGNNVFLTREEAEKALAEMGDKDDVHH